MKKITFLLIIPTIIFAQLGYQAGPLYREWPTNINQMACQIEVKTDNEIDLKRDPIQIIVLVDAFPLSILNIIAGNIAKSTGIIGSIKDNDYLGIITFARYGKNSFPMQIMNNSTRIKALKAIKEQSVTNGRHLGSGLDIVEEQFRQMNGLASSGKYVLFITDNISDSSNRNNDLDKIKKISTKYGVNFSTFGYDLSFDEDLLIDIAVLTEGRSFFIKEHDYSYMSIALTNEMKRVNNLSALDMNIFLSLPSGCKISKVIGGHLLNDVIHMGDLQASSSNPLFFVLSNRPERRRDITVDIEYNSAEGTTDESETFFLELPLSTEKAIKFDEINSPKLLEYDTHMKLESMANNLYSASTIKRQEIADTLYNRIEMLEEYNVTINSDYLRNVISNYRSIKIDLDNFANEDSLLVKELKYNLLNIGYGK